jgi:hypothetical protein
MQYTDSFAVGSSESEHARHRCISAQSQQSMIDLQPDVQHAVSIFGRSFSVSGSHFSQHVYGTLH